jgi:hypothetical protein
MHFVRDILLMVTMFHQQRDMRYARWKNDGE